MAFLESIDPRNSIRTRLIFWFLVLSLLPLSWITFISYESTKKTLITETKEHLTALSNRQAKSIGNYFREKERTAVSLSHGIAPLKTIEQLESTLRKYGEDSPEYETISRPLRSDLAFKSEMLGYQNLYLVSLGGEVIFSAYPSTIIGTNLNEELDPESKLRQIFETAKNFIQTDTTNFIYYDPSETPASFISVPLLNENLLIGVAIVQIDNTAIYKLLKDYSGLGETGETLLVTEIEGQPFTQSPMRNDPKQSSIHLVASDSPFGLYIRKIMAGERIVDEVIDYQGNETLMVGRYLLPGMHMGIVTKIDMDELLAPIDRLAFFFTLMSLATAGLVTLIATRIAETIARPILQLTKKTNLMAAGDFTQRIDIEGGDEIAHLGESFNIMADQLQNIIRHLDSLVAKRTEEVAHQNVELEKTIDELQQTQSRLINQEKLASLGSLTAGIAHEIKNPLNFINNFAELSLQIDKDMEDQVEKIKNSISSDDSNILHTYLETLKLNIGKIYEHGKRADSIVRNMLHHSRGISGEMILTDINALLEEYVALSYHGERARDPLFNVKIEKNLEPNLPQIYLVPQEISRVFLNILTNSYYSLKLKQQESPPSFVPTLRVSTKLQNQVIIIKIWDNGQGISEDIFPKLFTPFFSTKPSGEGTGLGLSLSYNIIVQGHQGTLSANSIFGEYAEFVITLPVKL